MRLAIFMSLRDWFAANAPEQDVQNIQLGYYSKEDRDAGKFLNRDKARWIYADSMLRAKRKIKDGIEI